MIHLSWKYQKNDLKYHAVSCLLIVTDHSFSQIRPPKDEKLNELVILHGISIQSSKDLNCHNKDVARKASLANALLDAKDKEFKSKVWHYYYSKFGSNKSKIQPGLINAPADLTIK